MELFTFDIDHIIKEPDGLHVQEVAYAGSSNLCEGGRGSGCHTQEPLQHSQPNAAATHTTTHNATTQRTQHNRHCSHPEGVPVVKFQVQVSLFPQVLLNLSTELAQDVLQAAGEGEGHVHTHTHTCE